jgi:hypothetical protein
VAAEVTWEHVPSRWQNVIDYAKHNQHNTAEDWESKQVLSLHPNRSADWRKENSRGLSLLVSYHSKMPTGFGWQPLDQALDGMEWYAGLRLDNYSVNSEFRWWFRNQSNAAEILPPPASAPTTPPPMYENGQGAFREEGSALVPGAFAGLRQKINDSFAFEVGVRYFGTKHWDFTPGTYFKNDTGGHSAVGRLNTGTSYGYGIEFALVCKL